MGICVNRKYSIRASNIGKSISFIKDFNYLEGSEAPCFQQSGILSIVNDITITKSFMNDRLRSKSVINYSILLIDKVYEALLIERKGNNSMYHSVGINQLSECKTKDEQLYLSKQNTVVNDWNEYFSNYYHKSQILNKEVEREERLSQINNISNEEESTFSNEIVSEINKVTSEKHTKSIINSNIKPKTQSINITQCKPTTLKLKHSRGKSTNFEGPINLNSIQIDLQHLHNSNTTKNVCKTIRSPRTTIKKINEFNISIDKNAKDGCNCDEYNVSVIDSSYSIAQLKKNDDLQQELILKKLNQPDKINMSPLNKNNNINNVEDMKRVLSEFKLKNSFLFPTNQQ